MSARLLRLGGPVFAVVVVGAAIGWLPARSPHVGAPHLMAPLAQMPRRLSARRNREVPRAAQLVVGGRRVVAPRRRTTARGRRMAGSVRAANGTQAE